MEQRLGSTLGAAGHARHLVLPARFGKVAELATLPGMDLPHVQLASPENFWDLIRTGMPGPKMPREVFDWRYRNAPNLVRGARKIAWAKLHRLPHFYGSLYLTVFRGDRVLDYGLASLRVVTNAGVAFLVDSLQGLVEPELLKFHAYGTGGGAEAATDTALTTELTTQYATDNVRPTGSQTENAANIYETVATLSPDATVTITEHMLMSQAAVGGGTGLDRSLFTGIPLTGGSDSLQTTYRFTLVAGS